MNALRLFLTTATDAQRATLAERAHTSESYLYQLAGGHRAAKVQLAADIEKASISISKRTRGRLPIIPRTELCPPCAECPYAKACKAVALAKTGPQDCDS